MKIAAVGDNCIDDYFQTGRKYPGGNPVNVSVYTVRQGRQASYTGVVGDDENGALIRAALQKKGVDVSHLHTLPGKTAVTQVELVNGDRQFRHYDEGVLARFAPMEDDLAFLAQHDLAVTGLWGKMERFLPALKAKGLPVAFDFANKFNSPIAEMALPYVDYAFFSADGLASGELERFMKAVKQKGPRLVVVTLGDQGSAAYDGARFQRFGIIPCDVKDTMGAGDSFISGFLVALLEGSPLASCMEAGARCSSVTLQTYGAWEP